MSATPDTAPELARTQQLPVATRKPTGRPSWPLLLVEGPEKSGKTWSVAELTATDQFSVSFWIDWGEGSSDEYGEIPGADYEIVLHDGTFDSVYEQVEKIHAYARQQHEAGAKPVLLVVDQMTAEWEALKQDAHERAVSSPSAKRKLAADPGAEISIPMNLWNDATERHYRFMRLLQTLRGVVVMISRGKEIAGLDDNGKPTGDRVYKVEGHKNLAYDASCWIRLSRDHAPRVIGARSVRHGIRPGIDKARPISDFNLERLVFEVLLGGSGAQVRDIAPAATESVDWDARLAEVEADYDGLRALWKDASAQRESALPEGFMDRISRAGDRARATQSEPMGDEDTADPDDDLVVCPSSRRPLDSGATTLQRGKDELTLCDDCTRWVPVDFEGDVRRFRGHTTTAPTTEGSER